jgi:hypothetical protein
MNKDADRIARRCGAAFCWITPSSDAGPDKPPAKGQYVMVMFTANEPADRQRYAFYCKHPLVDGWQEKIIKAVLSKKREKA